MTDKTNPTEIVLPLYDCKNPEHTKLLKDEGAVLLFAPDAEPKTATVAFDDDEIWLDFGGWPAKRFPHYFTHWCPLWQIRAEETTQIRVLPHETTDAY